MSSFKDFMGWSSNKDGVLTLVTMHTKINFYHKEDIDMLSWVVHYQTWSTFVCTNLQKQNFYLIAESDKDLLEKIRENVAGGHYVNFTRKAVVDETFFESLQLYANQL